MNKPDDQVLVYNWPAREYWKRPGDGMTWRRERAHTYLRREVERDVKPGGTLRLVPARMGEMG